MSKTIIITKSNQQNTQNSCSEDIIRGFFEVSSLFLLFSVFPEQANYINPVTKINADLTITICILFVIVQSIY